MRKIAILYLLGALLVSGCVRDEFDTTRVVEGAAARISLKITLPVMGGGTDTRAVSADVEKIVWTTCSYWYSTVGGKNSDQT